MFKFGAIQKDTEKSSFLFFFKLSYFSRPVKNDAKLLLLTHWKDKKETILNVISNEQIACTLAGFHWSRGSGPKTGVGLWALFRRQVDGTRAAGCFFLSLSRLLLFETCSLCAAGG